jgi:hypothetical protein
MITNNQKSRLPREFVTLFEKNKWNHYEWTLQETKETPNVFSLTQQLPKNQPLYIASIYTLEVEHVRSKYFQHMISGIKYFIYGDSVNNESYHIITLIGAENALKNMHKKKNGLNKNYPTEQEEQSKSVKPKTLSWPQRNLKTFACIMAGVGALATWTFQKIQPYIANYDVSDILKRKFQM